jgi:Dyp-type peroxidase family
MDDIQGNVIPGFNKDHVRLLFLQIDNAAAAKRWVEEISKSVATGREVWEFNQLFKWTGKRRGVEGAVKATWINIAFSYPGLRRLVPADADKFKDDAFRRGDEAADAQWVIGGEESAPGVVVIIAADDEHDAADAAQRVKDGIRAPGPSAGGVHIIYEQCGRTREDARGHEHFGWRDGISQPGIRGQLSKDKTDLLTPRKNPHENPNQGLPGQDLLWPGEFIFGYEGQDRNNVTAAGPDSLRPDGKLVAPEWAKNGSYLVFRRLRQDVGAFHKFLLDQSSKQGVAPEALGARLVGRWPSGAPLVRTPTKDKPRLGQNADKNNDFEYGPGDGGEKGSADQHGPDVPRDPDGLRCPFSAHIRKAYPRDETVAAGDPNPYERLGETLDESDTQTHRLLRRGIPYGPSSESTPEVPVQDAVDRGLLFMAYMTSISEQFEFISEHCLSDRNFKAPSTGVDPILGQENDGAAERIINSVMPGQKKPVKIKLGNWVTTTGGGYFFTPSIPGLRHLAE